MGANGSRGREPSTASQAVGLVADAVESAAAGLVARLESPPREPVAESPETAAPATAAATPEPPARFGAPASLITRMVSAVVRRVDMNAVLDRVDVQRVVDRVDVNAVVEQVDLDAALDKVDPNRVLDRIDIDQLVQRVDMGPVARDAIDGIDLPAVVRESTASLGGDTIHAARVQAMRADAGVAGLIDKPLGREGPRAPVELAAADTRRRAGIVSRLLATAVDVLMILLICVSLLVAVAAFRLLWGGQFDIVEGSETQNRLVAGLVLVVYLGYGWGLNGRTIGQILLGLRVVRTSGADVSFPRGFARAFLYLILPIGLVWVLFSRRNASLQDLWLTTVVVHDWGHIPTEDPPALRIGSTGSADRPPPPYRRDHAHRDRSP